ncbi:hypothetical protein [Arthrobacter sp. A5]|uniref:hypothetical protein n=1 Tax=Arthrobacter sp. A5 TaxID=576926 RepID=UPI003DA8D863
MTSLPSSEPNRSQPHASEPVQEAPERRRATVRRAPKFVPFLVLGALVGVLAAAIVAVAGPGSANFDRSTVFGFFAVLLALPGVALGGVLALLLDRASIRRSERIVLERAPGDDAAPAADQVP